MKHDVSGISVHGALVGQQTRCAHYATDRDVVAIKFACCEEFYSCHACHVESSGHAAYVWPRTRRDEHALLCGVCGSTLSISTYLSVVACPHCSAEFNPGCRLHTHLYFEV